MKQNTKIILLVIVSIFVPFIGIPLLIVILLKDKNQGSATVNNNQQPCLNEATEIKSDNTHSKLDEEILENRKSDITNTYEEENTKKFSLKEMIQHLPANMLKKLVSIVVFLLFVMVIAIILALSIPNRTGKTILQITAFTEISVAIIGLIYLFHKERYTCPECGTKRKHHRQFLETTSRQLIQKESGTNLTKRTVIYKHNYLDTYVCPSCGETMENRTSTDAGKIVYDYRGIIVYDNTKPPKEF